MEEVKLSREEKDKATKSRQAMEKEQRDYVKWLKSQNEVLEQEWKYYRYMLEVPVLRDKFLAAVKEGERLAEENANKTDNTTDLKPGTEIENKE